MKMAVYCRVSTDSARQLDSMENQKAFFSEYARKHSHELIRIYADEGISGRQMRKRGEFLHMLEDARLHSFELLVTKDVSRFARNTVDALTATRELRSLGIEVLFLANNQTILGNSEFILTLYSAMAQQESENLSLRVKFGKAQNAKKGRVPNFIFGYDKIDTFTLIPNPEQAKTVRRIFGLYTEEKLRTGAIARILRAENIPSFMGPPEHWCAKTVRRILQNEIYAGVLVNNKTETVDFITGKKKNSPISMQNKHKRPNLTIIDRATYCQAQLKLSAETRLRKKT